MTRDRLTTAAILAVLIAIGCWVAFNTYWAEITVTSPPQGAAATNRFYTLEHLLRGLGMQADETPILRAPTRRSDVLLVNQNSGDVAHGNLASVQQWVRNGGRLVVTTYLLRSSLALQTWSGITRALHDDSNAAKKSSVEQKNVDTAHIAPYRVGPKDSDCTPMNLQGAGIDDVETRDICGVPTEFSFSSKHTPAWSLSTGTGVHMLRVNIGDGTLTVIDSAFIDNQTDILRKDNALTFIEGSLLAKGDRLLIFNPTSAEPLLRMLWRLAAPAVVCFALAAALLIARHLPRFGPAVPVPANARRSLAEQLRANARFAWRTGNLKALRKAVLRALEHSAEQRIPGYGSLTPRRRADEIGKRAGVESAALNSAMTEDAAGDAKVQRAAIALLEQARRALINL
jgi:hypothetical protein